jgi:hypothetical protein
MIHCFEVTDRHLLGILTDYSSWDYSMNHELQSIHGDSEIEWPALRNHIPCMAQLIQVALAAFMSSLGVKGRTKSWDPHERDRQFGLTECIDIGKGQRHRKEGNARINIVSDTRPSFAKIIEKVCTSRYFECPQTDHHKAENAIFIEYANIWVMKRIHWFSKIQSPHRSTAGYGCEDMMEINTRVD